MLTKLDLDEERTADKKHKELADELHRQREVLDGIIPGYLRLRDTVENMKGEMSDLRRRLRESYRRYQNLTEQYERLSSRIDLHFKMPESEGNRVPNDTAMEVDDERTGRGVPKDGVHATDVGGERTVPVDERPKDVEGDVVGLVPPMSTGEKKNEKEKPKDLRPVDGLPKVVEGEDRAEGSQSSKQKEDVAGVADVQANAQKEVNPLKVGNNVAPQFSKHTLDSDMPPPPAPVVTVQPPTPHTSQEAGLAQPTTHLEVPKESTIGTTSNSADNPPKASSKSRSRSTSVFSEERR